MNVRWSDWGGMWYWTGLTMFAAAVVWVVYTSLDFSRF